jgi:HlyD family secretion protein
MTESETAAARTAELRQTLARAKASSGRGWVLGVVVVVAVAAAVLTDLRLGPSDIGPQFRTEVVTRGTLAVSVTATGTIESLTQVNVGTEISGIVERVLVDYNSPVEIGQLLATINPERLEAQAAQARASLAANRARLAQADATVAEAQQQLERLQQVFELSEGRVPSQQELDAQRAAVARADADRANAAAQVEQTEASVAVIDTDLRRAEIRSPIRGMVLARQVDPGQTVAASFQTPTLFTLAQDLTRMNLIVDVDEADIGGLEVGQAATFRVDAYPERAFVSQVVQIRSTPTQVNGVVTYETVLAVDNSDLLLRPGMTATAEVETTRADDALLVPNAALRFTPPTGDAARTIFQGPPGAGRVTTDDPTTRVWQLAGTEPMSVAVRTGVSDGEFTEVLEGPLSAGDTVIVDIVATAGAE